MSTRRVAGGAAGQATGSPARRGEPGSAGVTEPGTQGGLLAVGIAAVILLGVWGLLAPRSGDPHEGHPHVGDVVEFAGGTFSVDALRDVDLSAPMSGPGMMMGPSSGVPDIPEGFRWVSVDVTVTAGTDRTVDLDPAEFVVTGIGVGRAEPVSVDDGGTFVPAEASITRSFAYQVPEDASELELWAPGAHDPVMLQLGDAPDHHAH